MALQSLINLLTLTASITIIILLHSQISYKSFQTNNRIKNTQKLILNSSNQINFTQNRITKSYEQMNSLQCLETIYKKLGWKINYTLQYSGDYLGIQVYGDLISVLLDKNSLSEELNSLQSQYFRKKYIIQNEKQKKICALVNSFNSHKIKADIISFQSLITQKYNNFHIVYIDDGSNDDTYLNIQSHINSHPLNAKIKLVKNQNHLGDLLSFKKHAQQYCNKDEIIVAIKGSDRILGFNIFKLLNTFYEDPKLQITTSNILSQRFKHVIRNQLYHIQTQSQHLLLSYFISFNLTLFNKLNVQNFKNVPLPSVMKDVTKAMISIATDQHYKHIDELIYHSYDKV